MQKLISDPVDIAKVITDKAHRLRTIYSIVDKETHTVPLIPNIIQSRINADDSKLKIILKARQFGVTTNEVIKMLDHAMFNENKTACILAHEKDAIKKIFSIARIAHERLPKPFNFPLDKGGGSQYEMRFPVMNSKFYCDLESRGDTIDWLHVSEAAFVKEPMKVLATMQAVPLGGRITFESTANGMGNYFYEMWQSPPPGFSKHFYPWFLSPDYKIASEPLSFTEDEEKLMVFALSKFGVAITNDQIAYRRYKQKELGGVFIQEYPENEQSCFLASNRAAFDLVRVADLLERAPSPLRVVDGIKIFRERDKNKRYVIGADTSEGVGGDFSVAKIFEVGTREEIASFRGQVKPYDFANIIFKMGKMYETFRFPLCGVERNNHGHAVLLQLKEHCKYPNLFCHDDKDLDKIGWITDRVTRPVMIDAFIEGVENGTVQLSDEATLRECLTLVHNNGKIEAENGYHDDCVIAAAIAIQMCIKSGVSDIYQNISNYIRV